jgi:hypothetical protein
MKTSKTSIFLLKCAVLFLIGSCAAHAAEPGRARLNIRHDRENNRVVVTWYGGEGRLARADRVASRAFRSSSLREAPAPLEIEGDQGAYALVNAVGGVVSENMVGYVNLQLPWGMSLIANPLFQTNVSIRSLFPTAPDGAQVMKRVNGDYVTCVYSASSAGWVGPQMDLPLGTGFFFINPARDTFVQLFVGEVPTGSVTNNLPAGVSLEGSMLPLAGSVNSVHNVPGQPGDSIFVFINEGEARGRYHRSAYSAGEGWNPDLNLAVGQGFWIQKQQPQDWVRFFSLVPE